MSDSPKILIAIASSLEAGERRQAIRETWLANLPPNISYLFFTGSKLDTIQLLDDTVQLVVQEKASNVALKVLHFFSYALDKYAFDWIFKCDDDTYVNIDRLTSLIDDSCDFIGNEFLRMPCYPSGGAGYFIKRSAIKKALSQSEIDQQGAEDAIMGNLFGKCELVSLGTKRLHWANHPFPMHANNQVTSHWCDVEKLRTIHAMNIPEHVTVFDVIHPHWKDKLYLYDEGSFVRGSTCCVGTWRKPDNETLILEWDKWPHETLRVCPTGYSNVYMSMRVLQNLNHKPPGKIEIDLSNIPVFAVSAQRFIKRRDDLTALLARLNWQAPRYFHSELACAPGSRAWSSITFNHLVAISFMPPPFILLEDDVVTTAWFKSVILVPTDADAIWLGVTEYGMMHGQPTPGAACARGDASMPKISNMLGTHAILFLSHEFTLHIRDELLNLLRCSPNMPHDRLMAKLQEKWNIYGANPPLFYQNDGHLPCVTNSPIAVEEY